MSALKLKKQLEELILFQVENDIIEFPHSKAEFAPYVVTAICKGHSVSNPSDIVQDVLDQLDAQIQLEAMIPTVEVPKTIKERIKSWIKSLFKLA